MLLKAEGAKSGVRIDGQRLLRGSVGKKRNCDCDQASHEVRIAIPAVVQDFFAFGVRFHLALEPNLADAASHFVGVIVRLRAQGLERMAQFDDIAIPVLPVVERGEIIADVVDRQQRMRRPDCVVHGPYMGIYEGSASTPARILMLVRQGRRTVIKHKPWRKDRRMSLQLGKRPNSRLKIDLISSCDFKETRDGLKRPQAIRPHPSAVPLGQAMSANRYAATRRQEPARQARHSAVCSFKHETESNGAVLPGVKTWN